MSETFFYDSPYMQKYDVFRLTPYLWQPCISQFCEITKGWFCKFLAELRLLRIIVALKHRQAACQSYSGNSFSLS